METDLDTGDHQCGPLTPRPLSVWLVAASAAGLWGNVCRSVTFACDELAAALMSHNVWRLQSRVDLRAVDHFRAQLKAL